VANLVKNGLLRSPRTIRAFSEIDRRLFCPEGFADPYVDAPVPLGSGSSMTRRVLWRAFARANRRISLTRRACSPHMHAVALECLETALRPGARVLDVGSGSGCLTTMLAALASHSGCVVGVDLAEKVVQRARDSTQRAHLPHFAPVQYYAGDLLADTRGALRQLWCPSMRCVTHAQLRGKPWHRRCTTCSTWAWR
jgi:protein-L-isoaspartate(D-aspartate) O-methyltransferase